MKKTNAVRLLDTHNIKYKLIEYEVDESDLSVEHVAAQLREDIRQVFKTLVLRGNKTGLFVCVTPGNHEIDLKKAARVSGNKQCELIPMKELLPTTGYIRGGCSPLGMKKPLPTIIDTSATQFDTIYISAGVRGMQACLSPTDLANLIKAKFAEIV